MYGQGPDVLNVLGIHLVRGKRLILLWGMLIAVGTAILACVMLWNSFMQAVDNRRLNTVQHSRMLESSITRTIESVETSLLSLSEEITSLKGTDPELTHIIDRVNQIIRFAPHIRQITLSVDGDVRINTEGSVGGQLDLEALELVGKKIDVLSSGIKIGRQVPFRFLPVVGDAQSINSRRSLIPLLLDIHAEKGKGAYQLIAALNPDYIQNLFAELKLAEDDQFGILLFDNTEFLTGLLGQKRKDLHDALDRLVAEGNDELAMTLHGGIFPKSNVFMRLSDKYPFAVVVSANHKSTFNIWFQQSLFVILGIIISTLAIVSSALVMMRDYLKMSALQEQVRLLSSAVHQLPVSVVIASPDHVVQYVNPEFTKTFGYTSDEVLGEKPSILKSGFTPDSTYREMWKHLNKGQLWRGEFLNKSRDDVLVPVSSSISPIRNEEGEITHIIGILTDITERNQAEQAVRKLSQAVEQSPSIVMITDANAIIEYVNPRFEEVTGYSFEEAVGQRPGFMNSGEESRQKYEELWQAITTGKEWRGEFRNKHKDGSLYSESATISPIKSPDGTITNYLAVMEDITERQDLEAQVRRAQKMEAVGQLTGGIAHDFNNILGIVLGNLELLRGIVGSDSKALFRVEKAISGIRRGAKLTNKLLSFSRKVGSEVHLTRVNRFIENLEELIAKSLTVSVTVTTRLAGDLWPVMVNSGEFDDTLLNLSLNARDAMPDGGKLTIETANVVLDDAYVEENPDAWVGEFVMVSVSDTGVGMDDEVMSMMFEPFYSTKDLGSGTGLGLSMVYGFVQRSDGHLNVTSRPGEGTTFRLFLPRAVEGVEFEETADGAAPGTSGKGCVLVVDDEEGLREVATACLQESGYTTLAASDGEQALEVLRAHPETDLLFSDVVMPGGLDGYQLALAAHREFPDLKILLASGFTKRLDDGVEEESGFSARLARTMLKKPYSQQGLADAVRKVLEEET